MGTGNAGKVTSLLWRRCSEPNTMGESGQFVLIGRWAPPPVLRVEILPLIDLCWPLTFKTGCDARTKIKENRKTC